MLRARRRLTLAIVVALAGLSLWTPAFAISTAGQREIEEALTCQCGCGLTVASCNHLECGFAVPVRKHIAEALAAGQTAEQILDSYKKEYGEKVLSSPVPEGFNLLAWIAPFVAILAAGGGMFTYLRRRKLTPEPIADVSSPVATADVSDARLARLRQEVEDLER